MSESRMYTIPGGVQKEAKKALEWRKEHKRGGTPVGLNTARTLAKGGQIGIEKVRHIAKYFPRHEVDKKGKGWAPGDDKFPSNGRIAWALWGGDAAQRWASAIVERENKKEATTAGGGAYGFVDNEEQDELNAFKMAHELDPYLGPEFMARVRLDNSGIDRLYKVEVDGQVYLWDGSAWDNMGHVDGDVYSYDSALDDPRDSVEKTHVLIDPSSAIIISAFLQERPFQPVTLDEIDPEETALMSEGIFDEDFETIDLVMTAAGETPIGRKDKKGLTDGDGQFTPEERSELAKKQPRDASGLFVKVGSRTVVAGDKARGSGTLESIDYKNGKVNVRLDSGKLIAVDPKYTDKEENAEDVAPAAPRSDAPAPSVNTDGILGKARKDDSLRKATLPEKADVLAPDAVNKMLLGWRQDVTEKRAEISTSATSPEADAQSDFDEDGKYVVKKNDSLWSIAEKTKSDGQSTEDQWLKILDANKDNLKSGDPNLIYPDEKVNVPGRTATNPARAEKPSAQEAMRKDKQDTSRSDDAAKKKAAADQERIRKAKQDESRAAKPNAQEAMRKDKQDLSKAEAAKAKSSADQDKITNARNADRLDTTAKAKAKAQADARAGMQADKKAISDAEAAKKKSGADQEKLRNARNADRTDVTAKAKAKAKAAADARTGMQSDKKAISDAEAAKKKAGADQEKLRNARNADRADTSAKAKADAAQKGKDAVQADKKATSDAESAKKKSSADQETLRNARNSDRADVTKSAKAKSTQQTKDAMVGDKKQVSKDIANKAAQEKAKSGVQANKQAESSGITKTVDQKAKDATQKKLNEAKKQDQPVIKEAQVSNVRKKLAEKKEFYRKQREKYGTYKERVDQSKARQEKNN